jgi:hypothetical protein
MRGVFVLAAIVIALLLGTVVAGSESRVLTGALIVAYAPAIWGLSYLTERMIGRDMWEFSAPYPYRRMREER